MEHVTACYWQKETPAELFYLCSNENTVGWGFPWYAPVSRTTGNW